MSRSTFRGKLERAFDPTVDERGIRWPNPHPRTPHRLYSELGVQLRGGAAELDRLLQRRPKRWPVELQSVGVADRMPELRLLPAIRLQLERPMQEG